MSDEFEKFFGPKPEPQEIQLTKNIHSWRCSSRLWPTLDAFVDEWPELMPRGSKSTLYSSVDELLVEVGDRAGPRYVRWASQIIRHKKPELVSSLKNCRSLMFLLGKWRRDKVEDVCPECGEDENNCTHEWGSQRRQSKYSTPE